MNIFLINHYAGSNEMGMEFRPFLMAKQWVRMGHDVTVVAADYSHLRKVNPSVKKDFTEEYIDGVRFLWIKTPKYHGNGVKRVLNVLTAVAKLNAKAAWLAEKYKPEYVIASSTYLYDIYPAKKIADISGGKLFYEIHDIWPLTQIEITGLGEKNPLVKSMQKAEDFSYANAGVISILPNAKLHLDERGFKDTPYYHIPNGIEPLSEQERLPLPQNLYCIKALKESGKKILMYVGGFAKSNAMQNITEAAKLLEGMCEVVLVGDGAERTQLEKYAEENNIRNIHFTGMVSKLAVPACLELADMLYLGTKRIPLYRYGVGINKMFDYMYSGKPIILGLESPNNPIEAAGCGIVIEPENTTAIADAAKRLLELPQEELLRIGELGRSYVMENHEYSRLAERFLQALKGEI